MINRSDEIVADPVREGIDRHLGAIDGETAECRIESLELNGSEPFAVADAVKAGLGARPGIGSRCIGVCCIGRRSRAIGRTERPVAAERGRTMLTQAGSPFTASMLRDLERKGRTEVDHILGFMLAKARDILVGEVALAEKSTKDEAETLLDKVLTEA